jgi:hypothetical protein
LFDADGRSAAFMTRCHRLEPLSAYVVPPPENDDFWDSTVDTDAYINLGNEGATRTTTYARCALLLLPVVDGNALDALLEVGEFEAGVDEFRRAPSLSTFAELCRWCAQQSRLEWIASDVVDLLEFAARNDCALELLCTLAQHVPYSVDRRFVASVARASLSSGGGVDLLVPIVRRLARTLTSGAVADVLNQFSEPVETVRAVLEAVDATASIASEDGAALAQALARVAHASLVEPIGRLLLVLQGSDERLECIRALWDHADAGALRPMLLDTMRAHPLANVPHAVALLQLCCALIDDERLIDSVVVERVLAPPLRSTLLVPLIEELIKLNVNCDALHRLCRARIDDLDRLLAPGAPVFSWSLPVAYGVDRADLQAFMRDSERSQAVLSNFNSIHDARSAARRWSCAMPLRCVASGAGKHARVSVEKTRSAHQAAVDAYQRNVAEKQRLEQWMQVARGASRKRARAVDIDNKDEQHDA